MSLLIRGARVIDPFAGSDEVRDLLVGGDRSNGREPEVFEAEGLIVAPGFIDLHCHLREPGFEYKGTVAGETAAALRGGFTTVCAMPNTNPPHDNRATVEFVLQQAEAAGNARVLPIGCVTKGRAGQELAEMAELAEAGCVAFSDDGSPLADPALMRHAMEYAAALRLPIIEHCDTPELSGKGVMHEGLVSSRLGLPGQPSQAEVASIARNIELAALTGCHLHVAHISTADGLELVRRAKERDLPVTCEVTPSHLFLTDETVLAPPYNTNAKVNPPLRTEADRKALIAGVNDGTIDVIATDHAPHAWTEKECEFDQAAFGISCAETAVGSLMTQVARGELDLRRVVEALTVGPASVIGLSREQLGDESWVLIDPAVEWTVDPSRFLSLGRNSPLDGTTLTGRVVATIQDGRLTRHDAVEVTA
jgi:dihydroorotase